MSISLLSEERKANLCHMFEFRRKLLKQWDTSCSFTVSKWEATCPTSVSQVQMHDLLVPYSSFSTCKETPHGDGLDIPKTQQSQSLIPNTLSGHNFVFHSRIDKKSNTGSCYLSLMCHQAEEGLAPHVCVWYSHLSTGLHPGNSQH